MWLILCFVLSRFYLMVEGFGNDEILGQGKLQVVSYLQCEDEDQYALQFKIERRKINRTHDAFSMIVDFDREINVTYSMEILAYKEVDGGFKFYQKLTDESFCNWLVKYAGTNWPKMLEMANVDPPECPIPVGKFEVKDFVVDFSQYKEDAIYGTYDVNLFLLYMGDRVGCIRALVRFEKYNEDQDDDDDDDC